MTELESQETRRCPSGNPIEMQKTFIWAGALMFVCILALLMIMLKYTGGQPAASGQGEDRPELQLARAPASAPQTGQVAHQVITLPSGLGNQQMQLINTPLPSGLGNQQMQLINTPLPSGLGNQQMQLIAQNGPYLGVGFSELQAGASPQQGQKATGALVSTVMPGSPGQKAGIQVGDILLTLDQKAVTQPADVGSILAGKRAGEVVKAIVTRDGVSKSMHVTLANVPLGATVGDPGDTVWLGADIQNIDAIIRIQFNLADSNGVIISYVAPQSPAVAAGLAMGDVIKRIGETRISDVRQLSSIISKSAPGQQLRLVVERAGKPMNVAVTLGRRPTAPEAVPMISPPDVTIEAAWIGMDIAELEGKDVVSLGLPRGTRGILVIDVEGPPAMTVGFQTGDVILSVNNVLTPDMQTFSTAANQQTGAVVDVLRGNKHLLLSVPPPGFTAQGTKLNTGTNKKFQQVATVQPVLVGVLAQNKNLQSPVGAEGVSDGLILVDQAKGSYAVAELSKNTVLSSLLQQLGVGVLICSDVSVQTANVLNGSKIAVYSGVVGTVQDSINLYQQQGLIPLGGK